MKVVAFLPVKGNSERIQNKNMYLLNGKPLFLHTLEKLVKCKFIDEVYLDSESDNILTYAEYLPYIALKRDPSLASNKTDGHQLFYNEVKHVDADIYIQILGTSPFISPKTIKKGVDILKKNSNYDSVVLVKKDKQYLWDEDGHTKYDSNHIPNSKDLPDTIIETMGLYIVRASVAHTEKKRFGSNVYFLEAEPLESIDINVPQDIELAELVMRGINSQKRQYLRTITHIFNSSIFSDILDEYNRKCCISGLTMNLKNKKVFGWANTLKLRALEEGEDYRGIYEGLNTYTHMEEGNIIIVQNDTPHLAYFGELNANLAKRAGCSAAIIDSVTRDVSEVKALDFPVFSRGFSCKDVKRFATVESHNQPIVIQDVTIYPNDLIFADVNGIIVIPQNIEDEVITKALQVVQTESSIINKIANNYNAIDIYKEDGEF